MIARPARSRGASASTASAAMFASARSASGRSSSRRSACLTSIETPLSAAFRSVASTACGSKSNASTGSKPSFAAAIERTPEPQPTSSTLPRSSPASSSRQSCVVGCPPVPNARPGSITTAIAPSSGSSHGGPIQSEPTRTGLWNCRQRSSQSSSTTDAAAPPNACQIRSSPAAFVYAASSSPPSPAISSKPSGKSSIITARACSARASGTVTETRRRSVTPTPAFSEWRF